MEQIINNLQMVFMAMGFLMLAWTSNMLLSIYQNVSMYNEKFSIGKFFKGIVKMFVLCVSTGIITLILTLFPEYLTNFGVQIEGLEGFNVMAIAIAYATVAYKYLKKSVTKLMEILNSEELTNYEISDEEIDNYII